MRRFEVTEGASRKFWQIEVTGNTTTVQFGRLGTQGQSKTKHFADALVAEREAQALIQEKVHKGYREVAVVAPPAASAVQATLRDPTGEQLVLARRGNQVIVGEGSQRRVQTLDSPAEAQEHFERVLLLRRKAGFVVLRNEECAAETIRPPDLLETQDFDGKIELIEGRWTLTFEGDADQRISNELARALVRRLGTDAPRCAQIICDFASPKQAWALALAAVQLPSITAFIFDTHFQTQTRQTENSIGDLAAVLRACPRLQRLFATGNLKLSPVAHTTLQALHLLGNPLSAALAKGLLGCSFPALERLVLSLGADDGPADDGAILDAIVTLQAPRLREVHLSGVAEVPEFLDRLATRGLPPALKILSFMGTWHGAYELDELRPTLTRHAAALCQLTTLALVDEDDTELAALRAEWPFVGCMQPWANLTLPAEYQTW